MRKPTQSSNAVVDFNDENSNSSANATFDSIFSSRMSRRNLLRGGLGMAATVALPASGLAGCGSDTAVASAPVVAEKLLGFAAVAKSLADTVSVPAGYSVAVLYALGDPLFESTPSYKNDSTDTAFDERAGDHNDGMEWFGLSANNSPSPVATDRGILAVNHEATTDERLSSFFIHADGGTTTLPRPAAEVDKEVALHGVSLVEVRKNGNAWEYVKGSAFNHRFTPLTDIEISGPARGNGLMVTKYSTNGTKARGTVNNCGTGKTPWGTSLTGEENWAGYFARSATDNTARGNDKSVASLNRYGRTQGAASRHGWETGGTADKYVRWNNSKIGASIDGSDDYRNELNSMGFVVEIDAYDKSKLAKKRTGLGRFAHESASFSKATAGQPLAVYMGDDSRNEYIYKFVSTASWDAADTNPSNRMATGDKYLDSGKLYVAKFAAEGTGSWVELSITNALISGYASYKFADQGDVLINARLAADAAGATKMDRPEWNGVNPSNGEVYFTLTNNSNRRIEPSSSAQSAPDAANPRVYTDMKGAIAQVGNPNGHILCLKDASTVATSFVWDVYLFGAEAGADKSTVNISNLTNDQDFSSPDGLVFSPYTGLCWIQTDDGAYTDVTNCMMLAAAPGQVGDGTVKALTYPRTSGGDLVVNARVGATPTADTLKRFLVGPSACEITGLCETPDGKTMFINIQHPGETTAQANLADPTKYASQWPSNAGYGAGKRPRSATIVITKNDGGRIGS